MNSINSLSRFNQNPSLYLPNMNGLIDIPPINADQFNDEFEGYDLDSKWTVGGTGYTSYNVNTSMPSYLWINFPDSVAGDSNSFTIVQSTDIGTGLFSITLKASGVVWEGGQNMGIYLYDADSTNGVRLLWTSDNSGKRNLYLSYLTSGKWTTTIAIIYLWSTDFYLHLQRYASNVWNGWVNTTGSKTWFEVGQITKSITVAKIQCKTSMLTNAGQSNNVHQTAGIDWVRKDFISL